MAMIAISQPWRQLPHQISIDPTRGRVAVSARSPRVRQERPATGWVAARPVEAVRLMVWGLGTEPLSVIEGKEAKVGGPDQRQLEPPEGVARPARRDKAGPPRQARVELTPQQEALPADYVLHV